MRRVVITGMGILSCLGTDKAQVIQSLQKGKSGIKFNESYAERGFKSQVSGSVNVEFESKIDRKYLRFMGKAAAYAYLAMEEAIHHANLTPEMVSSERTGIVASSGGASSANIVESADIIRNKGVKKVGPYRVPRTMGSTISACLANSFKIKGINYSITSACATSAHCIGHAFEQIQMGKQDVIFAGGGEEEHWTQTGLFDAMGALSSNFNDHSEKASRAFDTARSGFVIAAGGGIVVLESLDHALARGANILAEITGYAATSDGYDMVAPSGEGAKRCMQQALDMANHSVDYINAHGTGTPVGDVKEMQAIEAVYQNSSIPLISSTKSLSGHSLGAAGAHELIYCLLMLENKFLAASANLDHLDPAINDQIPIIKETLFDKPVDTMMSNSFGFGGTNATLIIKRYN